MVKLAFACDCAGHVVLDNLEFLKVMRWQVEVKRVAVIKFRLDKRCCNDTGSFEVESVTYASEVPNVVGTST